MKRIFGFLTVCLFIHISIPVKMQAQNEDIYPDIWQVIACTDSSYIDIFAGNKREASIKELDLSAFTVTSENNTRVHFNEDRVIVYYNEDMGVGALDEVTGNITDRITITVTGSGLAPFTQELSIVECPENIETPVCVDEPEGFAYAIWETWRSTQTNIELYTSPVVGDLNGDGFSEIVVARVLSYRLSQNLYVYDGKERSMAPIPINTPTMHALSTGQIGLVRVNDKSLIVLCCTDGYLYAYDPYNLKGNAVASNFVWKSNAQIVSNYTGEAGAVSFADFNNDGIAEVYAGHRIFNAATGELLVTIPNNGATGKFNIIDGYIEYMPAVADINGNGTLEYICGTKIYTVDIEAGTAEEYFDITDEPGVTLPITDGITMLADFNKDGHLDVFVLLPYSYASLSMVIWDIKNRKVLGSRSNFASGGPGYCVGIPFIGDVDADGNLEIMFTSLNRINGFRWNGTDGSTLEYAYYLSTIDGSGATGITLFDFNQTGRPQLVFRDESNMRILEALPETSSGGASGTFRDVVTIGGVMSGTYLESPVVADVDNDGAAEIVTTGNASSKSQTGSLRIYESGNEFNWAPARKVWNQTTYNVVNINDDLTIPRYRMNQARIFGYNTDTNDNIPDGTPHQPYNNSLQQQTVLNVEGYPFRPLPYAVWTSEPEYTRENNQIVVRASIANRGDVDLETPIAIAAYRENIHPDNRIGIYNFDHVIAPGDGTDLEASFDLPDDDQTSRIIITVNDDGTGTAEQDQCNVVSQNIIYFVQAADDHIIKEGFPSSLTIDISGNDYLGKHPTEDRDIYLSDGMHTLELAGSVDYEGTEPQHGTIVWSDGKIIYTPNPGEAFYGRDEFTYRLTVDNGDLVLSNEATVVVEYIRAEDDIFTLPDYGATELDLIANDDSLPNLAGDTLRTATFILPDEGNGLTAPKLGTVAINPEDTSVVYTPTGGGRDGLDSFEYQISYPNPNADPEDESTHYIISTATAYVWVLNQNRITCTETEAITLDMPAGAVYTWYDAAVGGNPLSTSNGTLFVEKPDGGVLAEQWLEVSYAPGGGENIFEGSERIHVPVRFQPSIMYWRTAATNSNWNDVTNWTNEAGVPFDPDLGFIPSECTVVHIPGNAAAYPNLNNTNTIRNDVHGEPICNQIIFHFGGEVARQDSLTYNRAFIQYNTGYYQDGALANADPLSAAPMARDRWYALSVPLKKAATGDFSFGGWPNTWQRSFIRNTTISGDWAGDFSVPFNTNDVELGNGTAYSFAFRANGFSNERGSSNQSGLNAVNGIIELPYFENEEASGAHRIHAYNPANKVSSFQYYYWQVDGQPLAPASEKAFGTINRGSNNEAYRFVTDGNINNNGVFSITDIPSGSEVMIGNPLMSSLDFDELYRANSYSMANSYRIFNGSGFVTYSATTGGDMRYIAPLQAFFINTTAAGTVNIQFPLATVSVTTPGEGGKLKSSAEESGGKPNVLYVTSESGDKTSLATLAFMDTDEEDVPALFYPGAKDAAQMYFIGASDKRNAIQFAAYGEEVRMGYSMETRGKVTLYFNNIENLYTSSLILKDLWTGKEQDLLEEPVYTFESTSASFTDRFILKTGERTDAPTGNGDVSDDRNVNVYTQGNRFIVRSTMLIDKVQVYDLQGIARSVEDNISSDYYTHPLSGHGVFIVKVTTADGRENVRKITY